METKEVLMVIGICVSLISSAGIYFGIILKIKDDMSSGFSAISSRVSAIETKTELFWHCIEGKVSDMLKTFPTDLDKDVLLDNFVKKTITRQDAERLRTILDCEIKNVADDKKFAYIMLLGRIESVIFDLREREVIT